MESTYIFELLPSSSAAPFYTSCQRQDDNAGFDLFVPEEHVLQPGEKKLISMGVKGKMLKKHPFIKEHAVHYWMPPRSSISKTGLILLNSIGVIDKTYRGELMAFVQNISAATVTVKKGDRLVQIVAPDMGPIQQIRLVSELDVTERGEGGFGSSGGVAGAVNA